MTSSLRFLISQLSQSTIKRLKKRFILLKLETLKPRKTLKREKRSPSKSLFNLRKSQPPPWVNLTAKLINMSLTLQHPRKFSPRNLTKNYTNCP